jgi:hypothetical protein
LNPVVNHENNQYIKDNSITLCPLQQLPQGTTVANPVQQFRGDIKNKKMKDPFPDARFVAQLGDGPPV